MVLAGHPLTESEDLTELRKGGLAASPYYFKIDMPFYHHHLKSFLPNTIIDVHTHVTTPDEHIEGAPEPVFWAEKVCPNGMTLRGLLQSYVLLFPGKLVSPVVFPMPSRRLDSETGNRYAAEASSEFRLPSLILTDPGWSPEELDRRVDAGGFVGLKPYPVKAQNIDPDQIEIYDYLPREHLALANERRWLVILHIPRPERLADRVNIRQLLEIDEKYPEARVVVAHVGRAYCPRFGEGLDHLRDTENILFDISANTNQNAFERLLDTIEVDRILFGSDMPVTAMRARRYCEGDNYVNVVLGADWEDEHTMIGRSEHRITFFLYEAIVAFRRAAESRGLTRNDITKVFFKNAKRILE